MKLTNIKRIENKCFKALKIIDSENYTFCVIYKASDIYNSIVKITNKISEKYIIDDIYNIVYSPEKRKWTLGPNPNEEGYMNISNMISNRFRNIPFEIVSDICGNNTRILFQFSTHYILSRVSKLSLINKDGKIDNRTPEQRSYELKKHFQELGYSKVIVKYESSLNEGYKYTVTVAEFPGEYMHNNYKRLIHTTVFRPANINKSICRGIPHAEKMKRLKIHFKERDNVDIDIKKNHNGSYTINICGTNISRTGSITTLLKLDSIYHKPKSMPPHELRSQRAKDDFKKAIESVRQLMKKNNIDIIDIIGCTISNAKISYKCNDCGYISNLIKFNNIYHTGKGLCVKCGRKLKESKLIDYLVNKHPSWIMLSKFIDEKTKIKFCTKYDNRVFCLTPLSIVYDNAKNPFNRTTNIEQDVFNLLYDCRIEFYPYLRPIWLNGLEADAYLFNDSIIIECQGPIHYNSNLPNYETTHNNDLKKIELACKLNKQILYYCPYIDAPDTLNGIHVIKSIEELKEKLTLLNVSTNDSSFEYGYKLNERSFGAISNENIKKVSIKYYSKNDWRRHHKCDEDFKVYQYAKVVNILDELPYKNRDDKNVSNKKQAKKESPKKEKIFTCYVYEELETAKPIAIFRSKDSEQFTNLTDYRLRKAPTPNGLLKRRTKLTESEISGVSNDIKKFLCDFYLDMTERKKIIKYSIKIKDIIDEFNYDEISSDVDAPSISQLHRIFAKRFYYINMNKNGNKDIVFVRKDDFINIEDFHNFVTRENAWKLNIRRKEKNDKTNVISKYNYNSIINDAKKCSIESRSEFKRKMGGQYTYLIKTDQYEKFKHDMGWFINKSTTPIIGIKDGVIIKTFNTQKEAAKYAKKDPRNFKYYIKNEIVIDGIVYKYKT